MQAELVTIMEGRNVDKVCENKLLVGLELLKIFNVQISNQIRGKLPKLGYFNV